MIYKLSYKHCLGPALMMTYLFMIIGCSSDAEVIATSGVGGDVSTLIPPIALMPPQTVRPDFIQYLSPEESSYVPIDLFNASDKGSGTINLVSEKFLVRDPRFGYRSQICVGIDVSPPLAQPGDDFSNSVQDRIILQIDGKLVTEIEMHSAMSAPVKTTQDGKTAWLTPQTVCGAMVLTLGIHEVDFQFVQTDGMIQAYSWQFALTNDAFVLPTAKPEEIFTPQIMTVEVEGEPVNTPTDLP